MAQQRASSPPHTSTSSPLNAACPIERHFAGRRRKPSCRNGPSQRCTPTGDGRTYTMHVTLDRAARIEYLIAYRHRFELDAGNPLTVPSPAGPPRSELRMPDYRPPPALPASGPRGIVEDAAFESHRGERRRIRVYVPSTSRRPLPILYVHDGDIVLDELGLPSILDALIGGGSIAPAFVAFIDAADRHDDYEPGSAFRSV